MDWKWAVAHFCAREGRAKVIGATRPPLEESPRPEHQIFSGAPTLPLEAADPVEDRADFISGQEVVAMIPVTRLLQIFRLQEKRRNPSHRPV